MRGDLPVSGFRVRISPSETTRIHYPVGGDQTDAEGRFEIPLWREGRYQIVVFDPQGTPSDFAWEDIEAPGLSRDFVLGTYEITGRVTTQSEDPVPDARVGIRWPVEIGMSLRMTRTDDDGRFSFSIDDQSGPAEITAMKSGYDDDVAHLEVVGDVPPQPLRLTLRRRPGTAGRVIGPGGRPLADIEVSAYRAVPDGPMQHLGRDRTDAQGRFHVAGAPAAVTHLFLTGPGCPLTHSRLPPGVGRHEETVLTCPNSPASVRLSLRDADGASLPGLGVFLRNGDTVIPDSLLARHLASFGLSPRSDGRGLLLLAALAPGDYILYRADATNPGAILSGYPGGLLTHVALDPLDFREADVIVP